MPSTMARHQLQTIDWYWIIGYLLICFGLSIYYLTRSRRSIQSYFLADRHVSWWMLGTSIVATTFSVDTPLFVNGRVIIEGIAGNWMWWSVAPSGLLGVFFFAALWRRSGCLTQVELVKIRYQPSRARWLRLFYVFYHAVIQNAFVLGTINLAMVKVVEWCTPLNGLTALLVCFIITVFYTMIGGAGGVMLNDLFQFLIAMLAAYLIAFYAVRETTGSIDGLLQQLHALNLSDRLDYFPTPGSTSFSAFIIYITLYWITSTPTDGKGYAVQRMLSARNEQHAIWGYLWFNVAHYVIRTWPWIIVGLCALVHFHQQGQPDLLAQVETAEPTYIQLMLETCPQWLIGLALVSLLAAYMSTVNTQLNWSASYLINDLYMPYLNPGRSDRHYVRASHLATLLVALIGAGVTLQMKSIFGGWSIVIDLMAGMGVVGILRWLWWRVTAWTEIGCMLGAGLSTVLTKVFAPALADLHPLFAPQPTMPFTLLITVPVALLGALIGTFAVRAEPAEVLRAFVQRVQPPGPGWVRWRDEHTVGQSIRRPLLLWGLATIAIYTALFGVGDLLLKSTGRGSLLCALSLLLALIVGYFFRLNPAAAESLHLQGPDVNRQT
ncbi:MAG: Sodium/glucose cotransporter [Phycisphaerae bacterium]|nr:Sodium/glucose cotransporter [Phycisphaerae bacterium]